MAVRPAEHIVVSELVNLCVLQGIASLVSDDDFDLVIRASAFGAFFVQRSALADSVAVGAEERRAEFSF